MMKKENISFDEIKQLVNNSLLSFYKEDAVLLDYKTIDDAIAERCMVFHIGWHMLNLVRKSEKFGWANLDCEYNRNFDHPKSMYLATMNKIEEETKNAIPDLLLHKRRSNDENLLVIEFKKGKPAKSAFLNDEEKLEYFTDPEKAYKYSYGLYIELHKENVKIKVYQRGKHISSLDYTWEYKSRR